MASAWPKERLQPSLFDRLGDSLAPEIAQLAQDRAALDRLLDAPGRAALARLLQEEGRPGEEGMAALSNLGEEARALVERVLQLERARRREMRSAVVLSAAALREAVLRDLLSLLNTTATEADPTVGDAVLAPFPAVRASVLNYGIPGLAGHVRTMDDLVALAREIERAIECYEPRLRQVRVRPAQPPAGGGALASPVDLVIEAELWGYPVPEHLLVRTILDLDAGHVALAGPERTA
ncbi:type VI secretion system baseplate subunit TssE [Falsiroseomonas sp.]|uniref:type VI secretion system baseplate subunit TssE n=1 Tax=Falsiroseomonas sp. TaxID=2870721 RepID=UPI00356A540E